MLRLFEEVGEAGKNLAFMAHCSHPRELEPYVAQEAIRRVRSTGAVIRCQAPIISHVNDDADLWARMWTEQVKLGAVPYYMFVERDTGAKHYFALPLAKALRIFDEAYRKVSGLARTVPRTFDVGVTRQSPCRRRDGDRRRKDIRPQAASRPEPRLGGTTVLR